MKRSRLNTPFELEINEHWFAKHDILQTAEGHELIVLTPPRRKRWQRFLSRITFNLYKAPWNYRVKLFNYEESKT